jgi:hypothetical protein
MHRQANEKYMKISFADKSKKATNTFQERMYSLEIAEQRCLSHYFKKILNDNDGLCQLLSTNEGVHNIDPGKSLTYVIVPNKDGDPILKIRDMGHYFLAEKADFVYAAGEIKFSKDRKIEEINDIVGNLA